MFRLDDHFLSGTSNDRGGSTSHFLTVIDNQVLQGTALNVTTAAFCFALFFCYNLTGGYAMVEIKYVGDELWERIERAVEIVKQRLRRVTGALNAADVPYAIIGGNAVQHWVAQVDESVVRNTRDVDIILNRSDLPRAIAALEPCGFIFRQAAGVSMFLDGPKAKARDAVHVLFAGEKVREEYPEPVPHIDEYAMMQDARTLTLEALVRMKLTSNRDKDRVHIRDMISIGIIDESWLARYSPELQPRLQQLLDDPEG